MPGKTIKVFVSCPSDVLREQTHAENILRRLKIEHGREADIRFVRASAADRISAEQCEIAIFVLWNRLVPRLAEDGSRTAVSDTQTDLQAAAAGSCGEARTKILIYRRSGDFDRTGLSPDEEERRASEKDEATDLFNALQQSLQNCPGNTTATWQSYKTPQEFSERLENDLQDSLQTLLFGDQPPRGSWAGTPFVGMESFRLSHAAVFFGRAVATEDAVKSLRARAGTPVCLPSLLIVGASGSGKSSLARCGIAHRLQEVLPGVPLIEMRPCESGTDDPLTTLATKLQQIIPGAAELNVAKWLRHDAQSAIEDLLAIRRQSVGDSNGPCFVLILDQLEEVFTVESNSIAAQAPRVRSFASVVDLLVRQGICWCVATIRSDSLDRLGEYPEFAHFTEQGGVFALQPATPSEVRQMICRPARLAGLTFEQNWTTGQSLADLILEEARQESDDTPFLPLLQFTLQQLYEACAESGVLTFAAYQQLGGMQGCVASHANDVYSKLPAEQQSSFRSLARQLVNVSSEDGRISRRRYRESEFANDPAIRGLVAAFVNARLLVRDQTQSGSTVELTHESLLRSWPRLREWLSQEQQLLRQRSDLWQSYERWKEDQQRSDRLLQEGAPLDEAIEVVKSGVIEGSTLKDVRLFVDRSILRAKFRRNLRRTGLAAIVLMAAVASVLGVNSKLSENRVKQALKNEQESRAVATAATARTSEVSAQAILESIESSVSTLTQLDRLAANELNSDRLPRTLTYLSDAEELSRQQRETLLQQIKKLREDLANDDVGESLNKAESRIRDEVKFDPAYWQHRMTNVLREFPRTVWRRELKCKVLRALLSPDRRQLLLLTERGIDLSVVVWDIELNTPTECFIKLPITQERPHIVWMPDSKSFVLLHDTPTAGLLDYTTRITRIHSDTGKVLGGPAEHRGLVATIACSSDGRNLVVVNRFDGSPAGWLEAMAGNSDGSTTTVTQYELETMQRSATHSFDGWLIESAVANHWVAVTVMNKEHQRLEKLNNSVCLLDLSSLKERWYHEATALGGIGLSADGRFLAVSSSNGGFSVLERTEEKLEHRATAGSAPPGQMTIVASQGTEPDSDAPVDIVFGENIATEPGRLRPTRQNVACYTFDPVTSILLPRFNTSAPAAVSYVALHDGDSDGGLIAAGLADGSARVWQIVSGKPLTPALHLPSDCVLAEFGTTGEYVGAEKFLFITVTADGVVTKWDLCRNAIGEQLSSGLIARQSPVRINRDPDPSRVCSQSPDMSRSLWITSESRAAGCVLLGYGPEDAKPREIEIGFAVEEVHWTEDSRYAILIAGRAQKSVSGINPLYENKMMDLTLQKGGLGYSELSQIASLDVVNGRLVDRPISVAGPVVDVAFKSGRSEFDIAALLLSEQRGIIWRIKPDDMTYQSLHENLPEFCGVSVAADFSSAMITTRSGTPFAVQRGTAREQIRVTGGTQTGYVAIERLGSDGRLALVPASPNAELVYVNRKNRKTVLLGRHSGDTYVPELISVPGGTEFLITTRDATVVVHSAETGYAMKTLRFGAPVIRTAFSNDRRTVAFLCSNWVVSVYDLHTWNAIIPPIELPLVVGPDQRGNQPESLLQLDQFDFSDDGDLCIAQSVPMRLRLSPSGRRSEKTGVIQSLRDRRDELIVQGSGSLELDVNGPVQGEDELDGHDHYVSALRFADVEPDRALQFLKNITNMEMRPLWVAQKAAVLQLKTATRVNDVNAWISAVKYFSTQDYPLEIMDAADVSLLLKHSPICNVEKAGAMLARWRENRPPISGFPAYIADFSDAKTLFLCGEDSAAWKLYAPTLVDIGFRRASAQLNSGIGILLSPLLCGLSVGVAPDELVEYFDVPAAGQAPSRTVAMRYFCYLTGLPAPVVDYLGVVDLLADQQIVRFHRYCDELQRADGAAGALSVAKQMVENVKDGFQLAAYLDGAPPFPVLRCHCRLFEADALLRLGRFEDARLTIDAAGRDWDEYCERLRNMGLDSRALRPEEIGFSYLRKRLETRFTGR